MEFTGLKELDAVIEKSLSTLVYGEAGVGKTTLLMTIAGNLCRYVYPCIYVSTEDTLHYERVARYPERYENVYFTEIREFDDLVRYVVEALQYIPFKALFIDSVNALYRTVAYREDSIAKYGLILGVLWKRSNDLSAYMFASAQVRAGFEEDEEEIVASGMNIVDYWFDNIFYMGFEDGNRFLEVVKPGDEKGFRRYFMISDRGVEWILD